jgi:hypothetical protein
MTPAPAKGCFRFSGHRPGLVGVRSPAYWRPSSCRISLRRCSYSQHRDALVGLEPPALSAAAHSQSTAYVGSAPGLRGGLELGGKILGLPVPRLRFRGGRRGAARTRRAAGRRNAQAICKGVVARWIEGIYSACGVPAGPASTTGSSHKAAASEGDIARRSSCIHKSRASSSSCAGSTVRQRCCSW